MFAKKFIRLCLGLALITIAAILILGLFQPHDITVTRSVTINAPRPLVFEQMVKFRNWPSWSPWSRLDTTMKNEFKGDDGQPGSIYHWTGDDHKTGEAEITNKGVKGTEMQFSFVLIKPEKLEAHGSLTAEDAPGGTKASMSFTNHYNYPWNALIFMTNLERTIGPDLEKGLNNMKSLAEKR